MSDHFNSGDALFALNPCVFPLKPALCINDAEQWRAIRTIPDVEAELSRIYQRASWSLRRLPAYSEYQEDWYCVRAEERGRFEVAYCERGSINPFATGLDFMGVLLECVQLAMPSYVDAAVELSASLDPYQDQRLLLWLRYSSCIKQCYEIHPMLGQRYAVICVQWMRDELERMGVDVRDSRLLHGLMLSGVLRDEAFMMLADSQKT